MQNNNLKIRLIRFAVAVVLVVSGFYLFNHEYGLAVNESDSLPGSLFLIKKHSFPEEKGQYIAFKYIKHDEGFAPNEMPLLKIVTGIEGSVVEKIGNDFYVDGNHVGFAKLYTQKGLPINSLPIEKMTIPANKYWATGTHVDSFDSRYNDIGLIDKAQVIGKAWLLF
jgi:conjugal transfer pilin signal peptidase TrbI